MTYEEFLEFIVSGEQLEKCMCLFGYIGFAFLLGYVIIECIMHLVLCLSHKIRLKWLNSKLNKMNLSAVPIKCCPLCGGEADVSQKLKGYFAKKLDIGRIYCPTCEITTPNMLLVNAALMWNTRYTEQEEIITLLEKDTQTS